MSLSYRGGIISSTGAVSNGGNLTDTAPGVWKLSDIGYLTQTNAWPGTALRDPLFNNVSLLLNGNNTNGSQNNTFLDSSSNNFSITRNGNTTQGSLSPYQNHWSNYFDGSSYMYSTDPQIVPATGDFTIEAWVNLNWYDNPVSIFTQGYTGNSDYLQIFVTGYGDNIAIAIRIGTTIYYPTGPVLVNRWNHIAFQRTGSSVTGYLNGYAYLTATNSVSIASTPGPRIGATPVPSQYFIGHISNLRVSNIIRYSAPFTPPAAPFVSDANTMLLTCQSTTFKDSSSYNHDINLSGSNVVSRFAGTQLPQQYNLGNYGGSAFFDGSGDYLVTPSSALISNFSGDFTIEGWVYLTATSTNAVLIGGDGSNGWYVEYSSNRGFGAYDGSTFKGGNSSAVINQWVHYAITRASGTLRFFINGVVTATTTSSGFNYTQALGISAYSGGSSFINGYQSNIRINNTTALYTSAFTPPTAPLTAVSGTQLLTNFTNSGIIDSATINNLETVGNAQVSTSVKKFGAGSLAFDGSGDSLLAPSSLLFTLGPNPTFTIEGWIYLNAAQGSFTCIASTYANFNTGFANRWLLGVSSTTVRWWDSAGNFGASSSSLSTGQWIHVAVVGTGSLITLYINGSAVASQSSNFSYTTQNSLKVGGGVPGMSDFNGYIDDLRITKGVARYLQNFAVPVAPFPTY